MTMGVSGLEGHSRDLQHSLMTMEMCVLLEFGHVQNPQSEAALARERFRHDQMQMDQDQDQDQEVPLYVSHES
jgi:hypothetical protein